MSGRGISKGGRFRHCRRLRPVSLDGVTKPALRRLARRGGVKRALNPMYPDVRSAVKRYLEGLVRDTVLHTESRWSSTVSSADVVHAMRRSGKSLYGYGI
ncbi:histone H4 [Mycena crocata]|nr:histone H4 [Mycena crocata]